MNCGAYVLFISCHLRQERDASLTRMVIHMPDTPMQGGGSLRKGSATRSERPKPDFVPEGFNPNRKIEGSKKPRGKRTLGGWVILVLKVIAAVAFVAGMASLASCAGRNRIQTPGPLEEYTRRETSTTPTGTVEEVRRILTPAMAEFLLKQGAQAVEAAVSQGGFYDSNRRWISLRARNVDPYAGCYHTYLGRLVCSPEPEPNESGFLLQSFIHRLPDGGTEL